MRICQFHSGTAVGDAITNQMFLLKQLLKAEGYDSQIYAEHISAELNGEIIPITKYKDNPQDILIIHHSMGFDFFEQIVSLSCIKILIYHNITPERFFDDPITKSYIRKGLWQAREYRKYVSYAIADSNYNRKQLLDMGYTEVDVMPVQISLNRFEQVESDAVFAERYSNDINILFVGRVVPNKCQDDVIRSYAMFQNHYELRANLLIIGDDSNQHYVKRLIDLCEELGVRDKVKFLGKVSESQLKACYESANIFLCMSEHEGFGVPLLEAMAMKVPVIAFDSSAITETMGGAGFLIEKKNYAIVAGLINELLTNKELYDNCISLQSARIERLKQTDTKKILLSAIKNICNESRKRHIQLQGPFETSYSLAIVNRKLMEAFDDLNYDEISIHCTEGPGDYLPNINDLSKVPHAAELWRRSKDLTYPDITIRNMYPPRVSDVNGALNFQAFGWEESKIPHSYIKDFNKYLDGVGAMSNFVSQTLKDNGLTIPVETVGIGVELPVNYYELPKYKVKTNKKHKFLHISSAFPRKGVDILVEAYCSAFSGDDDVCLVLKTFPNPHNSVEHLLAAAKKKWPSMPEIIWINEDLPSEKLYGLYKMADCYVHVARGEGFGLPVAEAMLARVPVIVSPNTGLADFCNEDTAILIEYEMEAAHTHLSAGGSEWANPNLEDLKEKMSAFVQCNDFEGINRRVNNAYELISTQYSWESVAKRWYIFFDAVIAVREKIAVSMISTWNSKCGIAEFTKMHCLAMQRMVDFKLYPNYGVRLISEDELFVQKRLWHSANKGNLDNLIKAMQMSEEKIVHIQFNYGFFSLNELKKLIENIYQEKSIVISLHKTKEAEVAGRTVSIKSIRDSLNKCYRLIVHQKKDIEILLSYGIKADIISLIPLGQSTYKKYSSSYLKNKLNINSKLVLGSYGFLLPQKGILQNIRALSKVKLRFPDVRYIVCCSLHEDPLSSKYFEECKSTAAALGLLENIVFITDYLSNEEANIVLQICDILLMTYLPTDESASGAIRFCISAEKPIITTKQAIFEEYEDCTYQVDIGAETSLTEAIISLANDEQMRECYVNRVRNKIMQTNWSEISVKYYNLYKSANERNVDDFN